jgi:hypothetical protein
MMSEKPSESYQAYLIESLKDPEEAIGYLTASLRGGNKEVILIALRNVIKAHEDQTAKKRKVVYNSIFGGFGLSDEAEELCRKYRNQAGKDPDFFHLYDSRHDEILVRVVEELGDKANDKYSALAIEDVTDKYYINEYDGAETVIQRKDIEKDIEWE